jgi:hypothetical protein
MSDEPTSLSEMQAMTTEQFQTVDRYQFQGSMSKKRVLRHLVDLAAAELTWQGREDAGSLRDFWYNPVKSIMESAMPDWGDGAGTSDWNREMTKRLSAVVSEKVQSGQLTYRDLNILDDSRDRRIATRSLENDKILFVEKSAAYRKLEPLAEVYDITLVEGSGWQATALIEDLAQQLDQDQTYTFWVLGDFDPVGFGIVQDFIDRASDMGLDVDRAASRRIGIWPRQVADDVLEAQKFTPAGNGSDDEWFAEHAIDGEYGLEIEAVGASLEGKAEALRELVVDEIRDEIDADQRRYRDAQSSAANIPGHATSRVVSDITDDLEDALLDIACDIYADIDGVESCEPRRHMTAARVSLDREMVLNGGVDGDRVPDAYSASRLHSGAVSGNKPYAQGGGAAKKKMKGELKQRIRNGDVDVQELLDV